MDVQVIREVENPLGEQSHLVWGAAGVTFVELIVFEFDLFGAHRGRGWLKRGPERPRLGVGTGRNLQISGFARQIREPVGDASHFLLVVDHPHALIEGARLS